jgi:tetratricopeptide (TPR) repeat protein
MNPERSRNALACGPWICLLLIWACQPARASETSKNSYYQKALQLYGSFEYETALLMLEKAARWSSDDRADQIAIALLEGILAFEVQQPERGRDAFRRALTLDPSAKLTFSVSPKITAILGEVSAEIHASLATAQPQESREQEQPPAQAHARQEPANHPLQIAAVELSGPSRLKLPLAIGGGAITIGGLIAWGKARSFETRIRSADPSIMTPQRLGDTVHQGRTFERVGWLLMGLGVATTTGSLLLLDRIAPGSKVSVTPEPGGASLSASWSLP